MKSWIALLFLCLTPNLFAQSYPYSGPIGPITSGYGAPGPYTASITHFTLAPDSLRECQDTIRAILFRPQGLSGELPTIFHFPGSGIEDMTDESFENIMLVHGNYAASLGYNLVTMQYSSASYNDCGCAYQLSNEVLDLFPGQIDTTRIGIKGSSWGAGIANWLSLKRYINSGWGSNGRFTWCDAGSSFVGWIYDWPNDIYTQTDSGLAAMPDDVLYLHTYSEMDNVCDPRTMIDLYTHIGVPDSNKAFCLYRADTVNSHIYWATHFSIGTYSEDSAQFVAYITKNDGLDQWGYLRPLHALCAAAWNGDAMAKSIAVGDGDSLQTTWAQGQLKGPLVSDTPDHTTFYSWNTGQGYMSDCHVTWNMRQYVNPNACLDLSEPEWDALPKFEAAVYPNPLRVGDALHADLPAPLAEGRIVNTEGRVIAIFKRLDAVHLPAPGTYYVLFRLESGALYTAKISVLGRP